MFHIISHQLSDLPYMIAKMNMTPFFLPQAQLPTLNHLLSPGHLYVFKLLAFALASHSSYSIQHPSQIFKGQIRSYLSLLKILQWLSVGLFKIVTVYTHIHTHSFVTWCLCLTLFFKINTFYLLDISSLTTIDRYYIYHSYVHGIATKLIMHFTTEKILMQKSRYFKACILH